METCAVKVLVAACHTFCHAIACGVGDRRFAPIAKPKAILNADFHHIYHRSVVLLLNVLFCHNFNDLVNNNVAFFFLDRDIKKTAGSLLGSRFWTTYQSNKKARDNRERSALLLIGARICPEFEPHTNSKIAFYVLFFKYNNFYLLYFKYFSHNGIIAI